MFVRSPVRPVMPRSAPYRQVCWMECWIQALSTRSKNAGTLESSPSGPAEASGNHGLELVVAEKSTEVGADPEPLQGPCVSPRFRSDRRPNVASNAIAVSTNASDRATAASHDKFPSIPPTIGANANSAIKSGIVQRPEVLDSSPNGRRTALRHLIAGANQVRPRTAGRTLGLVEARRGSSGTGCYLAVTRRTED